MRVVSSDVALMSTPQLVHVAVNGYPDRLRELAELAAQTPEDLLDFDALERFLDALSAFQSRARKRWLELRSRHVVQVPRLELDALLTTVQALVRCHPMFAWGAGDTLVARFRERARNGEAAPRGAVEDLTRVVRRMSRLRELNAPPVLLAREAWLLASYLDPTLDTDDGSDEQLEPASRYDGFAGDPPPDAEIPRVFENALELCVEPFPTNLGVGEDYTALVRSSPRGSIEALVTLPRTLWSSGLAAGFLGQGGQITWGAGAELDSAGAAATLSSSAPSLARYGDALIRAARSGDAMVSFIAQPGAHPATRGFRCALGLNAL